MKSKHVYPWGRYLGEFNILCSWHKYNMFISYKQWFDCSSFYDTAESIANIYSFEQLQEFYPEIGA